MVTLQELISRGRFIFSGAPKRSQVFKLINGKLSAKEIARKVGRGHSSVLQDMEKFRDFELIKERKGKAGSVLKKNGSTVFEKTPLAKHIPDHFFEPVANTAILSKKGISKKIKVSTQKKIHIPSDIEILDICGKYGEDQLYEFKSPGTSTEKITKEIAAFSHTRNGGMVFYGVDDDGIIIGSDLKRQQFDQKIQNSVRNTISPTPNIEIKERKVMGSIILLIIIPPWDRKAIYQYTKDGRYYIRRGTNVFALKPDEIKKLSKGEYVI